jgi:hypothetical protein
MRMLLWLNNKRSYLVVVGSFYSLTKCKTPPSKTPETLPCHRVWVAR